MSIEQSPQRIVCAAVMLDSGKLLIGPRHWDQTMHKQCAALERVQYSPKEIDQGFIDQFGAFLTREEAWVIAERNGQIRRRVGGDTINGGTLFSENLY